MISQSREWQINNKLKHFKKKKLKHFISHSWTSIFY